MGREIVLQSQGSARHVRRRLSVVGALLSLALATAALDGLGATAAGVGYRASISPGPTSTLTQRAELTGEGESENGAFGLSVAISADGQTAIVGAPRDGATGSAFLFTRSGSTWVQQGPKLTGSEEAGEGHGEEGGGEGGEGRFGASVALSADGDTAIIGGPGDNGNVGSAWVFTRTGSTWAQQGPKLTGAGEAGEGRFGRAVSLSADGDTALIGGAADSAGAGAAWVFLRSGSSWTQQGPKLTGAGASGAAHFGGGVALSAAGSIALVSGPGDAGWAGAAWLFQRTGSGWVQLGQKLTGSGEIGEGHFGRSVALSADATSAIVGGRADDGQLGAAWVFASSGGIWTQHGGKLTAGGESGPGEFGYSVALSADGEVALVGGPRDQGHAGAAWAFSRTGDTWTQRGEKLTARNQAYNGWFGASVALSADGGTGLIGGSRENGRLGAAWVFQDGAPESVGAGETEPAHGVDAWSGAAAPITRPTVVSPGRCRVSIATRTIPVQSHARAALRLSGRGTRSCHGRLTLTVKTRAANRRLRSRTIAIGTFSIPAGTTRIVRVKLNAVGRSLLGAAHGRLGAMLAILEPYQLPARLQTAPVKLMLPSVSRSTRRR
jgi:hypothetical protein